MHVLHRSEQNDPTALSGKRNAAGDAGAAVKQDSGMVFDIQRFSVHDGPGIRTTVFLKGCPLRCGWCHNPEGMSASPQIMYNEEKCIGCGVCESACKRGVHGKKQDGSRLFAPERCVACGSCRRECPSGALTLVGARMSVDEVFETVLRDAAFYGGGGGVTFSGGEALMQPDFLLALLRRAKREGLQTAVDTSGYADWGTAIAPTLPCTDLYLYDVKAFSPELHRQLTGVDNARIKDNLRRLSEAGARIWIRMPLLHGLNDGEGELLGTARMLASLSGIERVEMMPYHVLGRAKYGMLGKSGQACYHAPTEEMLKSYRGVFAREGIAHIF